MATIRLLKGDCLQKLKELEDNSIDSVVTDPPYEIGFMGKGWDDSGIANNPELWKEVLRVLKPGGHLLSFSHSRTYHRQAVAVEDAGFEIRDQIMWIYGSGFPKSHDIGKNIEKIKVGGKANLTQVGTKKGLVATNHNDKAKTSNPSGFSYRTNQKGYSEVATDRTQVNGEIPVYEITNDYKGWGTALKPAHEPIVMARKPFKGTVADNVLEWGTGGINVDGCRVGNEVRTTPIHSTDVKEDNTLFGLHPTIQHERVETTEGRFPANIIFECTCENPSTKPAPKSGHWPKGKVKGFGEFGGGESSYEGVGPKEEGDMVIHTDPNCPCYVLDKQSGITKGSGKPNITKAGLGGGILGQYDGRKTMPTAKDIEMVRSIGDSGGASRFFYCPKASKKDRNEGCDDLQNAVGDYTNIASKRLKCNTCGKWGISTDHCKCEEPDWIQPETKNIHPTVKPTDLMAYLIRLVTPKGGIVLDPFMGSGSTGKACVREGMDFIGIEREDEYMEIAKKRIEHEQKKNKHTQFFG